MSDDKFREFLDGVGKHLRETKIFINNPKRIADIDEAMKIACELFPEAKITIEDDPLQIGSLYICIKDFDILVREPEKFYALVSKANNFDIYAIDEDNVAIDIAFDNALIRIDK